jgi:hypothetical protein
VGNRDGLAGRNCQMPPSWQTVQGLCSAAYVGLVRFFISFDFPIVSFSRLFCTLCFFCYDAKDPEGFLFVTVQLLDD